MKEWICEEVPALTVDEKVISTMFLPKKELVRCKECKWGDLTRNGFGENMILCYNGNTGIEDGYLQEPDWFCAEGERNELQKPN